MRWLFAFLLLIVPASAHEKWADGSAVPGWIKDSCCGAADAHQVDSSAVEQIGPSLWKVQGVDNPWKGTPLPSQDGQTWVFYNPKAVPSARLVYCIFIPWSF